ncbi:unnamed protein product, partial [Rotaria magnacalcarata]
MSTTNSFNYLCIKRFAHLLHVFVPFSRLSLNVHNHNERIYTHPLILLLLILINETGLQFVIYLAGLLPSQYYVELIKAPDKRDFSVFRCFLSSILYVQWRMRLVVYLHSFYFTQQRYYHLSNATQQNQNRGDSDHLSAYENYSVQTVDISEPDQESVNYIPTNSSQPSVSIKPPIDNP